MPVSDMNVHQLLACLYITHAAVTGYIANHSQEICWSVIGMIFQEPLAKCFDTH